MKYHVTVHKRIGGGGGGERGGASGPGFGNCTVMEGATGSHPIVFPRQRHEQ